MNDECKKACKALMGLIVRICTDCDSVPGGFNLSFGNDKINIIAHINLEYEVTKKFESDEIIEEFIERFFK